jgi:dihydroneopterin aldolase
MSHVPDTLRIELPELPCRIGVLEGENETPQPVRAVDYAPLHGTLVRLICDEQWTLIEGLAGAVMERTLRVGGVRAATVEVTKVTPPLGEATGPVTLRFRREAP